MNQNIIVLIIVIVAFGYTLYSLFKGIVLKKGTKCDGCCGCELKAVSQQNNKQLRHSKC